jgi:hypothetical protein
MAEQALSVAQRAAQDGGGGAAGGGVAALDDDRGARPGRPEREAGGAREGDQFGDQPLAAAPAAVEQTRTGCGHDERLLVDGM